MGTFRDYENGAAYLIKKYFECSLDAITENNSTGGILGISSLIEIDPATAEDQEARQRAGERIEQVYKLLSDPEFFIDRQKQVLSLSLGWIDGKYVGCKNVSEISRILGLSQPVVFNHYKLIVKKLQKHFDI
ncbi:sigma-70 family RNA polymerase sigma factor [Candidatus Nomurabacteria bacterium]|nr:sigma-70 family RNA polymerase sigma factor [Candidatus Nomurabacteria bacterium]